MNIIRKIFGISLIIAFTAFILLSIGKFVLSRTDIVTDMIYFPRYSDAYPDLSDDIEINIKNKKRNVYGLYSKGSNDKLIVFFHGNASLMDDNISIAKKFKNRGFSVLLVEYPGYGLAYSYKPGEKAIYSDSEALIKHVSLEYKYQPDDITFFGRSLGTGVASEMKKRKLGKKLILVSPYTSLSDLASEEYFPVIPSLIMKEKYSTKFKAKGIKDKVILIHGTEDDVIPYEHSVKLNRLFPDSELISVKRADHNNIFYFMDYDIINALSIYSSN